MNALIIIGDVEHFLTTLRLISHVSHKGKGSSKFHEMFCLTFRYFIYKKHQAVSLICFCYDSKELSNHVKMSKLFAAFTAALKVSDQAENV